MSKAPIIQPTPQPEEAFDVERFYEASITAQEEWGKRAFTPRHIERSIAAERPIAVTWTSDWHIGGLGTAHRRLRTDMQRIADHERIYLDLGGDWGDNFLSQLMIAGLDGTFATGNQQIEIIRLIFAPLAESGSVLAIRDGNHDKWTTKAANIDPRWAVFNDVPHLCTRDGSVIHLTVGSQTYKLFRRHRPRWYSVYNPAHCIVAEYQRNPYEFDVGVIEHEHVSHGAEFHGKERLDGSTLRIAIRPGTYKLDDSYADERGYYYASSELQSVIFWPDKFQMLRVRGLDLLCDVLKGL